MQKYKIKLRLQNIMWKNIKGKGDKGSGDKKAGTGTLKSLSLSVGVCP